MYFLRIRMSRLNLFIGAALLMAPVAVEADGPVVVELFTSQGCSSCPPADRLLAELSTHDYVLALALHVDYWDYMGWKDIFAQPAFSERQRNYARAWRERSVYTPQMVVQGVSYMVGSRADEIKRKIMQFEDSPSLVNLSVETVRDGARIEMAPVDVAVAASNVYLVRYSPGEEVMIERGENAGKTILYVNIVEAWETLDEWDGSGRLTLDVPQMEAGEYAVIVQEKGLGQIYAARRLSH